MLAVTPSATHNGERGFALAEGHISCMKGKGPMPRLVHLFKPLGLSSEAQLTPKVQLVGICKPGSQCSCQSISRNSASVVKLAGYAASA